MTTLRQLLEERVRDRLIEQGNSDYRSTEMSASAVNEFYAGNRGHRYFTTVAAESYQIIVDTVLPASSRELGLYQPIRSMLGDMIRQVESGRAQAKRRSRPVYNSSGLPTTDGPHGPDDAEMIGVDVSDQVALEDTGRRMPSVILALRAPTAADIERLEREHPTDRITGAPHHYVLNGDHSACGCGGSHLVECSIWNVRPWRHKGSICGLARTLCNHHPRHHYGQRCSDYRADDGAGTS